MSTSSLTPLKTPLRALRIVLCGVPLRRAINTCLLLCLALHTTAPVLHAAITAPACGFAEIRGVVRGEDNGIPLPNVSIYASGQSEFQFTETDATGNYTVTVPYYRDPGPYSIEFYPGFTSNDQTRSFLAIPITVAQVISGQTTILNAELPRGGVIQGQVNAADTDAAMEGVLVTAYRQVGDEFVLGKSAATDAQGKYAIYGLEAGNYALRYDTINIYSTPEIEAYETGYLGRVNYPSESPSVIVAESITTTANFSISLGTPIVGEIRRSDTNEIVSAVSVHAYLLDEDGSGRGDFINASNGSDFGTYYISSLATGKYLLFAQPYRTEGGGGPQYYGSWEMEVEWYKDAYTSAEAQVVEIPAISSGEPISVDITLSPGATITGVVTDADSGEPVPNIGVRIFEYTPTSEINIFFNYSFALNTDENGVYEIAGLHDGSYQLSYTPEFDSDYQTRGNNSFAGVPVTVAGTEVTPNKNFTVRRGGSIEGVLTDEQGQPLPNMTVSLVTTDTAYTLLEATSDATGKYRFDKIYPGEYLIKFDRFDPCGCYNSEYYTGVGDNATGRVMVEVGKTTAGINSSMSCDAPPPINALFLPKIQP